MAVVLSGWLPSRPSEIGAGDPTHLRRVYRGSGSGRGAPGGPLPRSSAMPLDPPAPVVVGVGQVMTPPELDLEPAEPPEPGELMARALWAAADGWCDVRQG